MILDNKKVQHDLKVKNILTSTLSIGTPYRLHMRRLKKSNVLKSVLFSKIVYHLINHWIALGKVLSNSDLNLTVLTYLTRDWRPKVTVISKKKSLSKMSLTALFGMLQEHKLELSQLEQHEEQEKK
ncbi:hypothetical protein Lal_00018854 [Lupinus albus]|nr:hypothetical protein Lal_00018854 [Lupinus albus]